MSALARAGRSLGRVAFPVKPVDVLMIGTFSGCAICVLLGHADKWELPATLFAVLAVTPIVLRSAEVHWRSTTLRIFTDVIWPVIAVLTSYESLNPVADFFHQPLADARLQAIDQWLFGTQLAVSIAPHLGPLTSDLLMICYSTYYLWPFLLGVMLYLLRGQEVFDRWSAIILSGIFLNYLCYMAVPAIGPRFAQAADFHQPVGGAIGGPLFEAYLRGALYRRDCFPSGHTAATLLVLFHSYRTLRAYFWAVLVPCLGLIFSTVAMRFHYGIDLLAAVPFAAFAYVFGGWLHSAFARGRELVYARSASAPVA